jgi:hypothetical protein
MDQKSNFNPIPEWCTLADAYIKTQIWCTLIAQLLLQVLKVKSESKKAFSTIAALIRIHLISHLDMFWMVQNCRRTYYKLKKRKKPPSIQMALF